MSSRIPRILLYVLSRDARLSDNPAFHAASLHVARPNSSRTSSNGDRRHRDDSLTSEHGSANFTHLLPVYVFPPNQIEVSGFLSSPSDKSPYPEARSEVARVWRTGPHRDWYSQNEHEGKISGVWMTDDDNTEEKTEVASVRKLAEQHGVDFKAWSDEKYFIDE